MPDLLLVRDTFTPTSTFGKLSRADTGEHLTETVERERDHNRPSTKDRPGACIPPGVYVCRRVNSPSHGDVFEVTGVPGRLYIQIHAANWSKQLRGCIAPGLSRLDTDAIPGADMVTESRRALARVMEVQKGLDSFVLTIEDAA